MRKILTIGISASIFLATPAHALSSGGIIDWLSKEFPGSNPKKAMFGNICVDSDKGRICQSKKEWNKWIEDYQPESETAQTSQSAISTAQFAKKPVRPSEIFGGLHLLDTQDEVKAVFCSSQDFTSVSGRQVLCAPGGFYPVFVPSEFLQLGSIEKAVGQDMFENAAARGELDVNQRTVLNSLLPGYSSLKFEDVVVAGAKFRLTLQFSGLPGLNAYWHQNLDTAKVNCAQWLNVNNFGKPIKGKEQDFCEYPQVLTKVLLVSDDPLISGTGSTILESLNQKYTAAGFKAQKYAGINKNDTGFSSSDGITKVDYVFSQRGNRSTATLTYELDDNAYKKLDQYSHQMADERAGKLKNTGVNKL